MNSAGRRAVISLLVISIAGCAQKQTKTVPPAQAQAPPIDAGKAGALYPPPLTPTQPQPDQQVPAPAPQVAKAPPPPTQPVQPSSNKKATSTHKPKPSASKPAASPTASSDAPATAPQTPGSPAAPPGQSPATSDVAANGEPAAASPIGELSTTGSAPGQTQSRKETSDLITNTENGLNGIKRALSSQEQETANQIKTFLAKAREALSNNDVDGAFTLATKAKVLLDELNKA